MIRPVASLAFAIAALMLRVSPATADEGGTWPDAYTLRRSDLPSSAPRFAQYPAPRWQGRPATVEVTTHPRSQQFRTRLRQAARLGPDFGGHYRIVSWGCGTGCLEHAILDLRSGRVHHPANFESTDPMNIDWKALEPPEGRLIKYRRDSRMLIVIGGINNDPALRGISYFVWDGERLDRIAFVAKPPGP
jgi:hypothetical protein